MTTTQLTTNGQTTVALIPEGQLADIDRLDEIVEQSQDLIRSARPMRRAFATAAALNAIEAAITPAMMKDFMQLMNSHLGFKTDRKPGTRDKNGKPVQPYDETTVKRCLIVALLAGASIAGNEFNIIAGQTYFTREFYERTILSFPGVTNFDYQVAVKSKNLAERTAQIYGRATWSMQGRKMQVICGDLDESGRQTPWLVVNCYPSSTPDQLRGLGVSKLFRRVLAKLSGLNLTSVEEAPTEGESTVKTVSAAARIAGPQLDDAQQAFVKAADQQIQQQPTVVKAGQAMNERLQELDATDWSVEAREVIEMELLKSKRSRSEQLQSTEKEPVNA